MRKRMLSLILATIMVCTMMIPAVSAAESTKNTGQSTRGAVCTRDFTVENYQIPSLSMHGEYELREARDGAILTIYASVRLDNVAGQLGDDVTVDIDAFYDRELYDSGTYRSRPFTQREFNCYLETVAHETNRAVGTFLFEFPPENFQPAEFTCSISYEYTYNRSSLGRS